MVVAVGTYAFLHARLGALKSELLTIDDWRRLIAAKDFAEQQQVLESTAYAEWTRASPLESLALLRQSVYRLARKIERSLPTEAARLTHLWARRDLLRNLKALLKGKALELSEDAIRAELIELDPRYQLPVDSLLRATSLDAALDLLEATSLRRWIRAARRIYEKDPTLFGLDAALDRLYYPELWRQLNRLAPHDRAGVRELIDMELDQVNVLWLLRYRLNYQLSPAETYYLLVPVTGTVDAEQLKRMVREETMDGMARCTSVVWLRQLLEAVESIWQVEVAFWRRRVLRARKVYRTAAFTLGEALALLVMKVAEVRDLVALLQASELNASSNQLDEQLVSSQARLSFQRSPHVASVAESR